MSYERKISCCTKCARGIQVKAVKVSDQRLTEFDLPGHSDRSLPPLVALTRVAVATAF
jgi:hypothetical protein